MGFWRKNWGKKPKSQKWGLGMVGKENYTGIEEGDTKEISCIRISKTLKKRERCRGKGSGREWASGGSTSKFLKIRSRGEMKEQPKN